MPTATEYIDSVRRPLLVAENSILGRNDAAAAVALISAAGQAAALAWTNTIDPARKAKLDNIVDELYRILTTEERTTLNVAIQKINDREELKESLEHPEDNVDDGGLCMDEPRCFGVKDDEYCEHATDCPAWFGTQIKAANDQIEELQDNIDGWQIGLEAAIEAAAQE